MRPMVYFFSFVLLLVSESIQALSGHGLVNPQSACNIRCENGGMCAFSFDNPQLHSCICLMGVYEGDRCQFQVGSPRESFSQSKHETSHPLHRGPPPKPTSAVDHKARQKEMEMQRDKQRRREYEQKLAAERREYERRIEEERRRAEESRPIGVLPVAANREEMERINELRRRDEELRRIAARRREEERRREHEQRLREEERRREFARQEEQRIRDERQRFEQIKMNEMHQKDAKDMMKAMTMEKHSTESTNMEDETNDSDGVLSNPDDWDYKSDEEDTTHDYLHGDDHEVNNGDVDIDEHTTTVGNTRASTEREQSEMLSGITKVIEMAADKTVMVHGIKLDKDSTTVGPGDDDYWDHSVKAEYEDFKTADGTSSHQLSDAAPAPMSDGVQQFNAVEGEEGWMMMKRVGEESSAATVALITTALTLVFRIW